MKQTAISLSSCEADFHAASACAGELLGLAELFKKLHKDVSVRLEMDSDSARHTLQRGGPGGLKHIELRCLAIQKWIREKRLSVSCGGNRPCTSYSRTIYNTKMATDGYDIAYTFTHNNITLEHNAMNNKNTIAHMDVHNTQY